MAIEPLEIIPQNEDGLSKSLELHINGKTILTPNFAIRPSSKLDLDAYYELKSKSILPYSSSLVIRYVDAHKFIEPDIKKSKQITLFGISIKQNFVDSINKDLILIDPSMEYLYYKGVDRFYSVPNLPKIIEEFVNDCSLRYGQKDYEKYKNYKYEQLLEILENNKLIRFNMVRDSFKWQLHYKSDLLIPPTPLIDSRRTLNISYLINQLSKEITKTYDTNIECATYYLLNISSLKNENIINDIKRNLDRDDSQVIIFKFKYLNLNTENYHREREIYKDLIYDLSYFSKETNKIFILLEGGNQTFPSAVRGFDIVSSSYNGDVDYRRNRSSTNRSPWGYWYNPEYMIFMDRESILRIARNNNGNLPCYCPVCNSVKNPELLEIEEWNSQRRFHYIHARHEEMKEIHDAIPKGETMIGAMDKLNRSQLKYLNDLF